MITYKRKTNANKTAILILRTIQKGQFFVKEVREEEIHRFLLPALSYYIEETEDFYGVHKELS